MDLETKNIAAEDLYKLLIGSVIPRPIAWVGSKGVNGVDNLAPFSFFNVASVLPPVISISFANKPNGSKKDSLNNIIETKDFSVAIVSHEMSEIMHNSGQALAANVDEFAHFDVIKQMCNHVNAPKVAGAKVVLECRYRELVEFGKTASNCLVLADVIAISVDDDIIDFPKIDMQKLDAIGRGAGANYTTTRDKFSLIRE